MHKLYAIHINNFTIADIDKIPSSSSYLTEFQIEFKLERIKNNEMHGFDYVIDTNGKTKKDILIFLLNRLLIYKILKGKNLE